jgi:NADPH-dependent glutamate synthase beta subunit-like oxidoreductase
MGIKRKKKKQLKVAASGVSSVSGSELRPKHNPRRPNCQATCPNHNDIRGFVTALALAEKQEMSEDEAYGLAFDRLAITNPFPSVCGRVCPHPCETGCNRVKFDASVAVNNVERSIGDWALDKGVELPRLEGEQTEKIGVVGAGPAGLSCAYQLARRGYAVTVFEALPKTGGMLRYGIPAYRLPRNILDAEVQRIAKLGVDIKTDTTIGKDVTYDQLREDYDAVFFGIGAHKGRPLRVEGEDAPNVLTGADYLNQVLEGEVPKQGDKVLVIGGGDTAIDAARMAVRHGAHVTIVYRRTRKEMPAIEPEIEGALEEGVVLHELAAPIEMMLDENGLATGMKVIKCELGALDSSGRRRPVPIEGSEWVIDATMVISAISQEPDFEPLPEVREGRDWIRVNDLYEMLLSGEVVDGAYAGGDVTDLALAVTAIAHGRFAAETIHAKLRGEQPQKEDLGEIIDSSGVSFPYYKEQMDEGKMRKDRHHVPEMAVADRFTDINAEIAPGLTSEQTTDEAKRCLSCGECFYCGTCYFYCQDGVIHKPLEYGHLYDFYRMEVCQGCSKCAEECPCGYILMT